MNARYVLLRAWRVLVGLVVFPLAWIALAVLIVIEVVSELARAADDGQE
jgi:hypothetical protein